MAQVVEEYVKMSDPAYSQRRQGIQNQINAVAPQLETALADSQKQYSQKVGELERQKSDYGQQATDSAAQRGLAWSNVSDNYRANYDKNSFQPAMTNLNDALGSTQNSLRESYDNRRMSLEDALNALTNEQYQYAMTQRQNDLDREANERQAAANRAAQQGSDISKYFNLGGADNATQPAQDFFDDWNGNYTYDPNGTWDEANQTWNANGGTWKWNPSQNKWQLMSGDLNTIYNNAGKSIIRQYQQGLASGAIR